MSNSIGTNTNSINLQLQTNEPISLDPTKKYFIYFVPTSISGTAAVTLTERNTGMTFSSSVNGYIKIKGRKIATVVANNISNGTLYLVDKDSVDISSLVGGSIVTLLANFFTNIYNQIMRLNFVGTGLVVAPFATQISIGVANFTTTQTVLQNMSNFVGIGKIYFSTFGAATGETDTLIVYDQAGNVVYSANVTNVQNQTIPLWGFTDSTSNNANISIVASGVTNPTGKISYKIVEGYIDE